MQAPLMDREIGLLVPAVTRQREENLSRVKVPDCHQVVDGGGGQEVAAAGKSRGHYLIRRYT